jgi:hypothetical protein
MTHELMVKGRLDMRSSKRAPGLGVTIAALMVLGCGGETEPTSPAPPPPAPVASVALDRDTATVAPGGTVQLAVTLKDAQGAPLTGRTVTWSSSSAVTASVSSTGLVTGLQVGQSRIVASAEGKSDTAIVLVPPAQVTVTPEPASAKTVTLGSAGGVIHTVGSDGIRYTLVVPPLALPAPVAITMTPLADVTGLPLSGGFVAGVDFKPDGLVFAQAATLTMEIITQVPGNQRLVGFTATSTGESLGLIPAKRAPNTITLAVGHFSISGAGFGTVQDLDALLLATPLQPGINGLFVHSLTILSQYSPRDGAFELQILEKWFDDVVLPAIKAATTDANLLLALTIFGDWDVLTPLFLDTHAHVPGGRNAPSLVSRRQQWEQEFIIKVKQAITANNLLCASPGLTATKIAALDNTLFWHGVAALRGTATAQNGLDLPSFYSALCVSIVSQNLTLADPLEELETHTLDVTFALSFSNGQSIVPADFLVHATASGASLTLPGATAQAPRGFYTGIVVPDPGADAVVLDLDACYAYHGNQPGVFGGTKLCHTEHLVRIINAALAITTGALPGGTVGASYSASLQASGGSGSYQWSVTAGQLPPGLSLAPGGTISGTPTTAGTFNFTVQVVSGTLSAQQALSISVGQSSAALVWHFDTDLEGWSCSSTNACKWQLLTSNQFPQTSGWVALQDIGEAVSRNIALPSDARFLRFDASTHNVPGDVSRVAVQVGGVTVLDQVFVNPGSNTAFNFVTMTIDISARAGQTVNIRFVQLDDGQGTGTTLKIDNISISPN